MMDNGRITIWMVMVFLHTLTAGHIKVTLKMTKNTVKVSIHGQMVELMTVNGKTAGSMVKVN